MEPPVHLLLTDREATEFRRSRRTHRVILVSAVTVLIVILIIIGPPIVKHIDAVAGFALAGATVDWDLTGGNWIRGGVTRVSAVNGQSILSDASLLRLKDLNHVEVVDLAGCELITARGLSTLSELRELKDLDVSRPHAVRQMLGPDRPSTKLSNDALVPLQKLTTLTNLSLAGNLITDDGLAMLSGLTNLETLDLTDTQVTDAGLKHLKPLTRLKTLLATGTGVTRKGTLELQVSIPGLTDINIDSDQLVDEASN